jgi:hypothetical protein
VSGNFGRDNCRVVAASLTTTGNTTVFTAAGYVQVIGVRVANLTGADVAVTISYYAIANTTQYRLIYQHLVPANGALWFPLEAFSLYPGDEIRVQAASSNALDVLVSLLEIPGRSG